MMRTDELRAVAKTKRLSLKNAEKDYVLDLLLHQIYGERGDMLVLKGGTALYKLYSLNRFSEDLDFTQNAKRFDADGFVTRIVRSLALVGVTAKADDLQEFGTEINVRFAVRGPLYDGSKESVCRVTVNISHRERVQLPTKREMVIPVSRELPSFNVVVMDLTEVMAEKVRALMTRNKARDAYDIWFLLKRGVRPDPVLIDRKLKIYKKKFTNAEFEEHLESKRGLWNLDLRDLIIGELLDFETIKGEIVTAFR